jgi:hypothetical protein
MNIQQNNLSNNNYNTSYILNPKEVYGDYKQGYNKYVPLNSNNVLAINIINNNNLPVNKDLSKINDIVYRNIQQGGIICESKLRTNINSKMCMRMTDEISTIRPPFEYSNVVETEYYLLHGENSKCSKYWKNRHSQPKLF